MQNDNVKVTNDKIWNILNLVFGFFLKYFFVICFSFHLANRNWKNFLSSHAAHNSWLNVLSTSSCIKSFGMLQQVHSRPRTALAKKNPKKPHNTCLPCAYGIRERELFQADEISFPLNVWSHILTKKRNYVYSTERINLCIHSRGGHRFLNCILCSL